MPTQTFLNLSEEKKQKILTAARKEFTRVPLQEASINNIIKEAQIPRGSFYQYFEGKEDLFYYILKERNEKLVKLIEKKLKENGDIFEMFLYFYDKLIEISENKENRELYKTVITNLKTNDFIPFERNENGNKSELNEYILKYADTSKFKNKEDLLLVINMLHVITKLSIFQTFNSIDEKKEMRKKYIKQIEYIKYGVIRKEKEC